MKQVLTNGQVVSYDYNKLSLLSRDQIMELLEFLVERISKQFIMMGGLLCVIRKNKWYTPYPNFMAFCEPEIGLSYRKVMQLIQIYESLVNNHVPLEEVSELGFTKMVLICPHLTEATALDIIAWAKKLKTHEIEAELKATADKSKGFLEKLAASAVLSPDYTEKIKVIKPNISALKQLITTTPVEKIIQALKVIYPEKDFVLA